MSRDNFIQMTVGGLTLDPVTKTPIVILKDPDNKLNLPIWIGLLEATAMATELEGIIGVDSVRRTACANPWMARR